MLERRLGGFVRECHGDLHLGNIALVDGEVTTFDCIEFNDDMRWSDVMADVAFLVMDLEDRGRPDLAARFLNAYLEQTGDYDGVRALRFYVVYRAMVRAKVAYLRASQTLQPSSHQMGLSSRRTSRRAKAKSAARPAPRETSGDRRDFCITPGRERNGPNGACGFCRTAL